MSTVPKINVRYFAASDGGVANGSFCKVICFPAWARGVKTYMNGDYMGSLTDDLKTLAECEAGAAELLAKGLTEYSAKDFKRLAPKCCGGKGDA